MVVTQEQVVDEAGLDPSERHKAAGGRRLAVEVHARLREMIVRGELPPGMPLLQAEMARKLNVSRTPMREAFRMLQEEGLIDHQPDQRAVVREIDPGELDSVYTARVMLESAAVSVTIASASADQVARMKAAQKRMRAHQADDQITQWQEAHREFHQITTEGAGAHLCRTIATLSETSERFVRVAQLGHPASWMRWDADHEALIEAFERRDHDAAIRTIAQHLARTAFTAMADIAPHMNALTTRAALNLLI